MATPENAISYQTSRDSPIARQVSRILTGLVAWVDDTYTPEQITYRRQRCRTRVVEARSNGEGMFRQDVDIRIHGAHMACDAPRAHEGRSPYFVTFHVEANAFWRTTTIDSAVTSFLDTGAVCGETQLSHQMYTKDDLELGLGIDTKIGWNQTFDTPDAFATHIETLRDLSVGALSMRQAAELLIGQPAGISDRKYLDI